MINNKIAIINTTESKVDLSYYNNENFFNVGVERGALDFIDKGIRLDLAICDFDHVLDNEYNLIREVSKETINLDINKDYLDGISAIEYVKNAGIEKIKYICKPSQRMDMNISVMEIMKKYENIEIYNEKSIMFKLQPGKNTIDFNRFQDYSYVSLLTLEDDNLVTIENMKFEAKDLNINVFDTMTYSNQFIPYKNPIITNSKKIAVIMTK